MGEQNWDAFGLPLVFLGGANVLVPLKSFGAPGLCDTICTHAKHKEVKEADEELKHDCLSYRVVH